MYVLDVLLYNYSYVAYVIQGFVRSCTYWLTKLKNFSVQLKEIIIYLKDKRRLVASCYTPTWSLVYTPVYNTASFVSLIVSVNG